MRQSMAFCPLSLGMRGRRLIPDQPIKPKELYSLSKILEIYRLANVTVGTRLVAGDHLIFFYRRSENDHLVVNIVSPGHPQGQFH